MFYLQETTPQLINGGEGGLSYNSSMPERERVKEKVRVMKVREGEREIKKKLTFQ
jgi:hypothetical protein